MIVVYYHIIKPVWNVQIKQKTSLYRKGRKPIDIRDKTVIIVDDGVATGATVLAALMWLVQKKTRTTILALPVAAVDTAYELCKRVATCVILEKPNTLNSVGSFYKEFEQVEEEEVKMLLERYHK